MAQLQRLSEKDLRKMKVAVWDLETTGLNAAWNHILCGSFMPLFGRKKDVHTCSISSLPGYKDAIWDDTELCRWLLQVCNQFDVLVGYNSAKFDAPMLNSRSITNKGAWLNPDIKHLDLYQFAKKQFRIGSNSLHSVLTQLGTKQKKTHLAPAVWQCATGGDQASLNLIIKHNIQDVVSLAEITRRLLKDVKLSYRYVR